MERCLLLDGTSDGFDQQMSHSPDTEKTARELEVEELERRIEILEALDDSTLGRFTAWDWTACITGAVLIPLFLLWWFAE